jgi:hypothetical protein
MMTTDTSRALAVVFEVKRDYAITFQKVIAPTVLIVYIGMSSVFLSASDHSGDRAALLGVSILICTCAGGSHHGISPCPRAAAAAVLRV